MTNRWGARHLLLAAVALVVGLVVGGLGPRSEARGLREQLEEAQAKECERGGGMGREIAQVFRGRPLEDNLPAPGEEPVAVDLKGKGVVVEGGERRGPRFRAEAEREGGGEGEGPEPSPEEAMKLAREAMELRRTQARAALEEAGATEEQLTSIDDAMDRMNDDLAALTETFVATVQEGGEPDRREMMMFAADTLDVLLEGGDALFGSLSDEQRADIDEAALDPFSYIDGAVVDELMKLEGLE